MSSAVKSFDILTTSLSVLHNYFNGITKLFSDLYLTKFLDILTKSFVCSLYIFLDNKKFCFLFISLYLSHLILIYLNPTKLLLD